MIVFEDHRFLQAAWALPLLLFAYLVYTVWQAKAQQKLGENKLVKNLIKGKSLRLGIVKFSLLILAYVSFVIALANPYSLTKDSRSTTVASTDIVFAIDVSNSMLVMDVIPSRLTKAKLFMDEVTARLAGEQVGISVFAGKAFPYLPLTSDYKTVRGAIKLISPEMMKWQGTSFGEALKISSLLLNSNQERTRVICILSDGESHQQEFSMLADSLLSKAGIHLFTFGLGTEAGDHIPLQQEDGSTAFKKDKEGKLVVSRLNQENLIRLVGNKSDRYQNLSESSSASIFLEKLRNLPSNKVVEQTAKQEYFQYLILTGLFFLLVELSVPSGRKYSK